MSLEVIYVARHGFRSNWLVDPATGDYSSSIRSPTGIASDPALTAHGVDQAKELGAHLLTVSPPIEAVYSSPYYRCLQTITPFVELKAEEVQRQTSASSVTVAGATNAAGETVSTQSAATSIRPESGIAEWYGAAPFEHPTPATAEVLKPMFPRYDETYRTAVVPAVKGETIEGLYERVAAGVGAIIDQCDAEGIRAVVLCSHAATIIALGRVLTGEIPTAVDVEDFRAFTCGLSVFRRRKNPPHTMSDVLAQGDSTCPSWKDGKGVRGGWICTQNSDCSFLSSGEERGWRFSGDESFDVVGSGSQADAGIALGVVVEGKPAGERHRQQPGTPRSSVGEHHL
ncbi:Transcription factor tau 55 kDa subunit like protein [Verticillium longisporum]|uniref:Transcription factor tau 55 kDa subunit like protein n=2 Tax=Verticillium longisporum TaxID=100787 RepID=A0A8I2ZRT5_VERLO|nr:Transcription factor tau 55 kDa subunit like protein [Verticillium longisporum]